MKRKELILGLLLPLVSAPFFNGCLECDEVVETFEVITADTGFESVGGEGTITLESSTGSFKAASDKGWVEIVSQSADAVVFSVSPNPEALLRTAEITLSGGSIKRSVTVLQKGSTFSIYGEDLTDDWTVTMDGSDGSDKPVEIFYDTSLETEPTVTVAADGQSWLTAAVEDGVIRLTRTLNYTAPRSTIVTVTQEWKTVEITVRQLPLWDISISVSDITATSATATLTPDPVESPVHYFALYAPADGLDGWTPEDQVAYFVEQYGSLASMFGYDSAEELVYEMLTESGVVEMNMGEDEPLEPVTDYVVVAFAVDEQLNIISKTYKEFFTTASDEYSQAYAKWLGTWTLTGANGTQTSFTISQGPTPGTDYTIDHYWDLLTKPENAIHTVLNDDGSMSFMAADLGINLNLGDPYGTGELYFAGIGQNPTNPSSNTVVTAGTYPDGAYVIGTATLTGEQAKVEANTVQLQGGSELTFTSMDYAAVAGQRVITWRWGEKGELQCPTFPMTMTKSGAAPARISTRSAVGMASKPVAGFSGNFAGRLSVRKSTLPGFEPSLRLNHVKAETSEISKAL